MKHTAARPFFDRIHDRDDRDLYHCQQALFTYFRFGADRRSRRAAQRDLAEARATKRWRR